LLLGNMGIKTENKLTILGSGTSSGVPMPGCDCLVCRSEHPGNHRLRTSALIEIDGLNILIDASTDLRQQALKFGIKRIDAVLFTHSHADHILGLDDLRSFNFVQRESIPCYGTEKTLLDLKRCFHYVFDPDPLYKGGALPQLVLHTINEHGPLAIRGRDLSLSTFPLRHGEGKVSGFRVNNLAYATDCSDIPEKSRESLQGLEYLILDGLRFREHSTHFTIPKAIDVAREIGAKKTYLIHTSHEVDYVAVSKELPEGIELAYDGLTLPIK